ncbi:PLP-dependent aminotransferase family protein [Chloroflexi bacterium TSY]|nr:PLP-dependent aminotransferase family protein [Chloroflexi bacterium TSY]
MTVVVELDRQTNQALYRQIVEQIKSQISDGRLPEKTQLPTVRHLASKLGVTRLTVQNAYSELQSDGWVEATIGRGTFVSGKIRPQAVAENMLSHARQQLTADAVINDLLQIHQLEIDQASGVRSMAVASPDSRLFPVDEFWDSLISLRPDAMSLVGYGSPQGDPLLRVEMTNLLQKRGLLVSPDEILITAGVTQGLALVAQALGQPGDTVLVEQPTYLGFLNILKSQKLNPIGIPLDNDGPQLDVLERAVIQHRPRFFYTTPSYQNPTGLCASQERREELLQLAERHGFLLIEDDLYGRLSYDGPPPLPIKSMDHSGSVIYLTSESKILMPGLRVGTVIAPWPLHDRLLTLRRATDLGNPPILQRALAEFLHDKGMQRHLKRVLPIYRKRRDAALYALRRYMPDSVTWTEPAGGFCIWVTLPRVHSLRDLYHSALQLGLALAPGEVFLTHPGKHLHLRLAFGNQTPEAIRAGIELLSKLIIKRLEQESHHNGRLYDLTPLV